MFRGFNVSLTNTDLMLSSYQGRGKEMLDTYSEEMLKSINRHLFHENILDGSNIQDNWFKQIDAQVFISYSHSDLSEARSLAGWLHKYLGLTSFIDANAWGYEDKLLEILIKQYRLNNNIDILSAAKHVHMMLATAIQMMIDRTECLLFLNTPNSIGVTESISKTKSPWIYYELALSQYIRVKSLDIHRNNMLKTARLNEEMQSMISYNVSLRHLPEISQSDFENIKRRGVKGTNALDVLYQNHSEGFEFLNG